MTPDKQEPFGQGVQDMLSTHPEVIEAVGVVELRRRGFCPRQMWNDLEVAAFLTNIYYILERQVLWIDVSPRQIQRQRRRLKRSPIVRTGLLCDREGRELCTVSQDATSEYYWPENIEDYLPKVMNVYFGSPAGYERPNRRHAVSRKFLP
jgi:hypothetical protein